MTRRKYTLEQCDVCGTIYDPDDYEDCPNCKTIKDMSDDDTNNILSGKDDDPYDGLFS